MTIKIIEKPITKAALAQIAKEGFGDMVKVVVDTKREIMAIGGELHADEEAMLIDHGSEQEALWGINLYPGKSDEEWLEFDSMINIRPSVGNRSRGVENPDIREFIKAIIKKLIIS